MGSLWDCLGNLMDNNLLHNFFKGSQKIVFRSKFRQIEVPVVEQPLMLSSLGLALIEIEMLVNDTCGMILH